MIQFYRFYAEFHELIDKNFGMTKMIFHWQNAFIPTQLAENSHILVI